MIWLDIFTIKKPQCYFLILFNWVLEVFFWGGGWGGVGVGFFWLCRVFLVVVFFSLFQDKD